MHCMPSMNLHPLLGVFCLLSVAGASYVEDSEALVQKSVGVKKHVDHGLGYSPLEVPACSADAGFDCRHLTVITPSFRGHWFQWDKLTESILKSLPEHDGSCGFECVSYQTVVSTELEKEQFIKRLDKMGKDKEWSVNRTSAMAARCPTSPGSGGRIRDLFRINTLNEILEMSDTRVPENVSDVKKEWLQAIKKMYACKASPDGVCFLLDSEGEVVRNSICHAASAYMQKKTVAMSPYPGRAFGHTEHKMQMDLSREMVRLGDNFGNFYAMENYHWFMEKRIVVEYLKRAPLLEFAIQGPHMHLKAFTEEAYYHFVHAGNYGYHFVDVYDEMRKALTPSNWMKLINVNRRPRNGKGIFEVNDDFLACIDMTDDELANVTRIYRDNGLLLARCHYPHSRAFAAVHQELDICISSMQSPDLVGIVNKSKSKSLLQLPGQLVSSSASEDHSDTSVRLRTAEVCGVSRPSGGSDKRLL